MGEVVNKRTVPTYDDIAMMSLGAVRRLTPWNQKQVRWLHRPMHKVGGAIDTEPLPGVCNHPVLTLPTEDLRRFAAAIGDGSALRRPLHEIGAIGVVDVAVVPLILVSDANCR